MLVLALDTSTPRVAVGLLEMQPPDEGRQYAGINSVARVLADRSADGSNQHGELLAPLIEEALTDARAQATDLEAVVVGLGPGPFTGLRVGVVTAATLADALQIPAYGRGSLDAVGLGHVADSGDLLVLSDARRKQVYWATYDAYGHRIEGPELGVPAELAQRFRASVARVVGSGLALYADVFNGYSIDRTNAYPEPQMLALLAQDWVFARAPGDELTPMYLRRPDARPPGAPKRVTPA